MVNRLRAEEATSRDNLAKLSALNEGLAADKVELHRTIAHLEEKLQHLDSLKNDVEEEKQIIRNELIKTEQAASDLKTQKTSLDTSLGEKRPDYDFVIVFRSILTEICRKNLY